jgi:hypothetical protein
MAGTCRIVAGASGSPGSVHALLAAVKLESPSRVPVTAAWKAPSCGWPARGQLP